MKSKSQSKIINIFILSMLIALIPIEFFSLSNFMGNINDSDYWDDFNSDKPNLKLLTISGKIRVDNNWTATKAMGICTGNGTYIEPYLIEKLEIDARNSGSCILIENSNVYFKIVNCTLSNSAGSANGGIKLNNVNNSQLIENMCFSNGCGIRLQNSANNIISDNIVNYNNFGIDLTNCNNNIVSGNTVNNDWFGIWIVGCNNYIM